MKIMFAALLTLFFCMGNGSAQFTLEPLGYSYDVLEPCFLTGLTILAALSETQHLLLFCI